MYRIITILLVIAVRFGYSQELVGKFVPKDKKQLLIIGQDLGAVGGFADPNNNGYFENVSDKLGGLNFCTNLPSLAGLKKNTNWGGGDVCGQCIADNPKYRNSVLSIGLYMVDQLKNINSGSIDRQIEELGSWIKERNRPVFLRIGYEFDGAWNHYNPKEFVNAWVRIKNIFDSLKVENCATVWQACTSPIDDIIDKKHEDITEWYPGDEYVDWVAYSWFVNDSTQYALTDELVNFAREHNKPVMVAESAAQGYDIGRKTKSNLSQIYNGKPGAGTVKKTSYEIWNEWFVPYFEYIEKNKDVIRAVAYIDCNWDVQALWGPPYNQGYWGDTRVESDKVILANWKNEITKSNWLHSSIDTFELMGFMKKEYGKRGGNYKR